MTAAEKKLTRYGLHEYVGLQTKPPVILAMQEYAEEEAIRFANFVGNRPLPEYSESTNKWRWWNNKGGYDYATTEEIYQIYKSQKQQP